MKQVFDPIRKLWVAATPEEIVRQTWILRMIEQSQFPRSLLAVEKQLSSLPYLEGEVPDRRIDLLSFMKVEDDFKPLLLMECKASALTQEALSQVIAYNHYVKAPYVAIVNLEEIMLYSKGKIWTFLPSFKELIYG